VFTHGKELYDRLKNLITRYLEQVKEELQQHSEENRTIFYDEKLLQLEIAAQQNDRLFGFLNRVWVMREIDEGKTDVYDVHTLHFVLWRKILSTASQESEMNAIAQVTEERQT
jgi:cullin 1